MVRRDLDFIRCVPCRFPVLRATLLCHVPKRPFLTHKEATLTRSELYEMIWKDPMTHVAKRFGVSDVALRKT
jgi:hypothetical protein